MADNYNVENYGFSKGCGMEEEYDSSRSVSEKDIPSSITPPPMPLAPVEDQDQTYDEANAKLSDRYRFYPVDAEQRKEDDPPQIPPPMRRRQLKLRGSDCYQPHSNSNSF